MEVTARFLEMLLGGATREDLDVVVAEAEVRGAGAEQVERLRTEHALALRIHEQMARQRSREATELQADADLGPARHALEAALDLWRAGARVTLVSGPVALPTPPGCTRVDVESARDMAAAVDAALPTDIAVMVAAVVGTASPARRLVRNSMTVMRRSPLVLGYPTSGPVRMSSARRCSWLGQCR